MTDEQYTTIVAVIGRPNAGKSTLINSIVGRKVAITSRRPQTTRHRIHAICTKDNYQFIFIDTPGANQAGRTVFLRELNKIARSGLPDADLVLFILDGLTWGGTEEEILKYFPKERLNCMAIVNKMDRFRQQHARVSAFLRALEEKNRFQEIVPLSARKPGDINYLEKILKKYAVKGEFIFSPEWHTDQGMRFYVAELIREKILRRFNLEVPYSAAVVIDRYDESGKKTHIKATIHVERGSHKHIIVGKGGLGLREVGKQVRQLLEKETGTHVDIRLWVKVSHSWSTNPKLLREFGYGTS